LKYAIISDVHANWEALQAVWESLLKEQVDRVIFLGDMVGYGPDPNQVIEYLTEHVDISLAGNHDWAALGRTSIDYFNPHAKAAILWTQGVLSQENRTILAELPLQHAEREESLLFVHATPYEPDQWHYIFTLEDALINFSAFEERICFVGHSHYPLFIESYRDNRVAILSNKGVLEIREENRYIINVGSVGQPRDGDPRACYLIYDSRARIIELKRVVYPITRTQEKMQAKGLSEYLIKRLGIGR